jgi:putative ABC transport system permease protein
MDTFWQDVKYGARMLAKSPGFTLVAVLTLALGIGANTAIFSVINGMLLLPLPYDDGEKIDFISEWSEEVPDMSFSVENFKDLRDQNRVFESLMAYRGEDVVMTGSGAPERLNTREVTAGMFDTLRIKPILGRAFTAEEDKAGAERVTLLGEGFWTRRFARDPGVLNKTLVLNGEPFTVIGVLPGRMHTSMRLTDLFTSLMRRETDLGGPTNRGNHPGIYVYARRKQGASVEQARAEVAGIAKRLAETYPNTNARQSMTVRSLHEALVEDSRPRLLMLLGAVGLVLLIACVNVANLLLGRAAVRSREIAVRTALGAGRGRIIRQMLTESLLLSALGAALGILLATWGVSGLLAGLPPDTPLVEAVAIDGRVLAFTVGLALLTSLIFGVVPAWRVSRSDMHETLKEGGRGGSAGRSHHRVHNALVVVETAMALILIVGTGLMLKSFWRVLQADAGFNPAGVITASVSGPEVKYKEPAQKLAFIEQVVARVRALPGVTEAASALPLLGGWQSGFTLEGKPEPPPGQMPSADVTRITPGYFRAMGIRLLKGRTFNEQDRAESTPVCMVDETFAAKHWPGENPVGKRVKFGRLQDKDGSPWMQVVGVVNHVKHYGVDQFSRVEMYLPSAQSPIPSFTLVVRTAGDPSSLAPAIRQAVQSVDPDVPTYRVETLDAIASDRVAERRLTALLITVFGALALVLAAVGIYGVMSYAVSRRTHEMGIRLALGAQREDIFKLVIANGMLLTGIGLTIGFAASFFGLSPLIASALFHVTATDPPTYAASPLLFLVVALLACWIPARRATRVDPMVALRYE